ncbi:MAG: hypothetical protein RL032_1709 [Pseudomonadota bacterium]|jgi:hypothetical protein
MKPTPQDRQRIEQCLEQLDAWRQSGMALKKYTEHHGHSYARWRAWLGFEAYWRQTLTGAASTRFVRARPAQDVAATPWPSPAPAPGLRIALQSHSGALVARIDWPLECAGAASASAAWLRQVLA